MIPTTSKAMPVTDSVALSVLNFCCCVEEAQKCFI